MFISTAPLQGVPCNASVNTAMSYKIDADGSNVTQLCFDQDHNYCPTVTSDGRILYLRWEYTDIPHVWGRYLFTMNPDGTCQREFYGSGGYWPNGIFYARPVPGHPTKVAGIVTGHHVGRVGELVIFDPAITYRDGGNVASDGAGHAVTPINRAYVLFDALDAVSEMVASNPDADYALELWADHIDEQFLTTTGNGDAARFRNKRGYVLLDHMMEFLYDDLFDKHTRGQLSNFWQTELMVDVTDLPCIEIDFPEDYEQARKKILPRFAD